MTQTRTMWRIAIAALALCLAECSSSTHGAGDTTPAMAGGGGASDVDLGAAGASAASAGAGATSGGGGTSAGSDAGAAGVAGSGGAAAAAGTGGVGGMSGAGEAGAGGMSDAGGITDACGVPASDDGSCTPPSLPSAEDSVRVDMSAPCSAPSHRASGFIYGIAQDGSQPPDETLSEIAVTHLRCGGAQLGCPNGGYVNGQYAARWNAVKAYYAKAKAADATLLILVHDIWGADAVCHVPRWPGQDGDWDEFTSFMAQLIDDAKANGMTGPDVRWELWNEPDYPAFWGGSQAQWLEMWKRGYQQVRAAIPGAVIEGPSLASGLGAWFGAFLDYVKANDVVPDYVSWHEAGGGGDPVNDADNARSALSSRGLDVAGLDISEYGSGDEQNPGHSAWFIARLERAEVDGLRSNWGGGSGLYSTMGGLMTGSWEPNAQFWVYRRYAQQTGLRARVTPGSQLDAVAYEDAGEAKSIIVVGNRGGTTGSVNVVVEHVPSWLQLNGATKVVLERMPDGAGASAAPTVVSSASAEVSCDRLNVPIDWNDARDGYAITLTAP